MSRNRARTRLPRFESFVVTTELLANSRRARTSTARGDPRRSRRCEVPFQHVGDWPTGPAALRGRRSAQRPYGSSPSRSIRASSLRGRDARCQSVRSEVSDLGANFSFLNVAPTFAVSGRKPLELGPISVCCKCARARRWGLWQASSSREDSSLGADCVLHMPEPLFVHFTKKVSRGHFVVVF